jgi:hypothetical protein
VKQMQSSLERKTHVYSRGTILRTGLCKNPCRLDNHTVVWSVCSSDLVCRATELGFSLQQLQGAASVFWDITPCSLLKVSRRFGGTFRLAPAELAACFALVPFLAKSWTLKMEAICSTETSVEFQRATRRCIPEDRTLHNHCYENKRFPAYYETRRFITMFKRPRHWSSSKAR